MSDEQDVGNVVPQTPELKSSGSWIRVSGSIKKRLDSSNSLLNRDARAFNLVCDFTKTVIISDSKTFSEKISGNEYLY